MINKAIVLAGGFGSRICRVLGCISKQFIRIHGLELIMYPITSLWETGIDSFIVVANPMNYHLLERIIEKYSRILGYDYVLDMNPYRETLNGNTALIGLKHVDKPVILSVSDHIYPPELVLKLLQCNKYGDVNVLGDPDPLIVDVEEATKIRVHGDRVIEESKNIDKPDYIDTGLFLVRSPVKLVNIFPEEKPVKLVDVMVNRYVDTRICVAENIVWKDIDVFEDLKYLYEEPLRKIVKRIVGTIVSRLGT